MDGNLTKTDLARVLTLLCWKFYSMNMLLLPFIGFSLSRHDWFTTQILHMLARCVPSYCNCGFALVSTCFVDLDHLSCCSLILAGASWKAGGTVRRSGLKGGNCGARLWFFFFLALVLGPGQATEPRVMVIAYLAGVRISWISHVSEYRCSALGWQHLERCLHANEMLLIIHH